MNAQTSERVSKLAARYVGLTADDLLSLTSTPELRAQTAGDIRSLAASALRQDETRGLRGLVKKVMGA